MTLHDPSQPHDEQPTARVHSFKVDIRLRFSLNIRLPRMGRRKLPVLPPSFRKDFSESGNVVKEGPVCATESDVFLRGCQWLSTGKANWFVLTETSLTLCASKRAAPQATILLHDIAKLERADGNPRRLILETKDGKCYLLTFRNNNDLHDLQDNVVCGVSNPWNFMHRVHVAIDPTTRKFTGLPDAWAKSLPSAYVCPLPVVKRGRRVFPDDIGDSKPSSDRVVLRIKLDAAGDTSHISTAISVTSDMTMRAILERVCRKLRLDAADCALVLAGHSDLKALVLEGDSKVGHLAMDDTVTDLRGRHELVLVRLGSALPCG